MVYAGMGGTDMFVIALGRDTLADLVKEVSSTRWPCFYFDHPVQCLKWYIIINSSDAEKVSLISFGDNGNGALL